jgi:hypothetical protein
MSARTRKHIIRSNEDAQAAFVSRKVEIDTMITQAPGAQDEHFSYSPDEVIWAHVGTVEHDADRLRRIAVMTFNEVEHAA